MIERVEIAVTDLAASQPLYDLLASPEIVLRPAEDTPATRRLHVAVFVAGRTDVDRFWLRGTAAGFRDDGRPGMRPQYAPDYYGAFLLDPDGNSVEAVTSDEDRTPGRIEHLWLRVADVAATRAAYLEIADAAGLRIGIDLPDRVQFRGAHGSVSFVAGEPVTSGARLVFAGGVEGPR